VLGRLPDTEVFLNLERYPQAEPVPGILALRIDAQFFFGNVSFLKQTLHRLVDESSTPVHTVVIEATSINRLDSSADVALHELAQWLEGRGIALRFAGIKGPVRDMMHRTGLWSKLGDDHFHFTVHDAAQAALEPISQPSPTPHVPRSAVA